MAEPLQLDKAAALVGKSEVTLRRLIKAGKIPFQKEKTLTGFIYLVDPDTVRAYYQVREGVIQSEDLAATFAASAAAQGPGYAGGGEEPLRPEPSYMPRQPDPVRIAVAGESGNAFEYWQKKSELYEDKYNDEVRRHAQAREELGMWRGRAEQAQSMLIKLLPAPDAGSLPAVASSQPAPTANATAANGDRMSWATVSLIAFLVLLLVAAGAAVFYVKFLAGT